MMLELGACAALLMLIAFGFGHHVAGTSWRRRYDLMLGNVHYLDIKPTWREQLFATMSRPTDEPVALEWIGSSVARRYPRAYRWWKRLPVPLRELALMVILRHRPSAPPETKFAEAAPRRQLRYGNALDQFIEDTVK
jgi:hypothetical protein